MARHESLTKEQVFGDGGKSSILHRYTPSNAEKLVGTVAEQGSVNIELTKGLSPVEERVVQALGTVGKKKTQKLRYQYDKEKGILRKNDDFSFLEPPITLPELSWKNIIGFISNKNERKLVLEDSLKWIEETTAGAMHTFEEKVLGAGNVLRRGGLLALPMDLYHSTRGALVDAVKAKADIEPWLIVWGIKGDPIKQAKEEQARLRSEFLSPLDREGLGLLVEDAMRYVIHGVHKPRSLILEFAAEQASRRIKRLDRLVDAFGTISNLTPERVRNIGPIIAADFIKDMNEALLAQPLQDHNTAEDIMRIEDMYQALISPDETTEAGIARANYINVLDYVVRDETGYNSTGPHIRKHDMYKQFKASVDELDKLTPKQLAKVFDGSSRLLMGKQILESVKAARILVHLQAQQLASASGASEQVITQ